MVRVWAYFLPLLLAEVVAVYASWEAFSAREGRIRYRITDIWALMLGLTPSFLLAAHTVHLIELDVTLLWPADYLFVLLAVLVMSQLAGLAVARLWYVDAPARERFGRLRSAASVVAGTVGGFVVLVFYVLAMKAIGRPF